MPQTYNPQYRDAAANDKYPLAQDSTQSAWPTNLLLDASLYVPTEFTPPFYISAADGGVPDAVRLTVADSRRVTIGQAVCNVNEDTGLLKDEYGRSMGVFVYDPEYMLLLKGELVSSYLAFTSAQTKLDSSVVRFYTPKGALNMVNGDTSFQNLVNMSFAGGVTYGPDNTVNLYGEHSNTQVPLRSINGRTGKVAFLIARVHEDYVQESSIRLENTGSSIKIGKSVDF